MMNAHDPPKPARLRPGRQQTRHRRPGVDLRHRYRQHDRNGRLLVGNRTGYAVQITPDKFPKDALGQHRVYVRLGRLLGMHAKVIQKSVQKQFKEPVVVQIVPAGPFYRAEEYHRDYYKHNEVRYKYYRFGCGRDRRLQLLWSNDKTSSNK